MTDDEIIAVVQAHKEGKKIQWRERCAPQLSWINHVEPNIQWNFSIIDYRVAPEPTPFLKGYCYAIYINEEPMVGMIKVQQIALDEGENPIPRKPREWLIHVPVNPIVDPTNVMIYSGDERHGSLPIHDGECVRVREVIE